MSVLDVTEEGNAVNDEELVETAGEGHEAGHNEPVMDNKMLVELFEYVVLSAFHHSLGTDVADAVGVVVVVAAAVDAAADEGVSRKQALTRALLPWP